MRDHDFLAFAEAACAGDRKRMKELFLIIRSHEDKKVGHGMVHGLDRVMAKLNIPTPSMFVLGDNKKYLDEIIPSLTFEDLVLDLEVLKEMQFLALEHERRDLLAMVRMTPRNRVFLYGPSGCGKTSLAEALAHRLKLPMVVANYSGLIRSHLGETGQAIKKLFEFVNQHPCLCFLDEFDSIGIRRGEKNDVTEMSRVINGLLMELDRFSSDSVLVCATNRLDLLDPALARRFDVSLDLNVPSIGQVEALFRLIERKHEVHLGNTMEMSKRFSEERKSYAEVYQHITREIRMQVITGTMHPTFVMPNSGEQ